VNIKARRLDVVAMVHATDTAEHYIADTLKRARAIEGDTDKVKRQERGLCVCCHYLNSRIGGAAMTTQPCAACGQAQTYGSTYTDVLCLPCAKEHRLCKHCGGDVDMKTRRRKWPAFENRGAE